MHTRKVGKPNIPKKVYNTFDSDGKPPARKGEVQISGGDGLSRDSKSNTVDLDNTSSKNPVLSQQNQKVYDNNLNITSGGDEPTSNIPSTFTDQDLSTFMNNNTKETPRPMGAHRQPLPEL